MVLKKWGKSRRSIYCTVCTHKVTILLYIENYYHCSHAAPFGASRRKAWQKCSENRALFLV